jgi:hypothetical protein
VASNDDRPVPTPPIQGGLDRKAVERILARAAQLSNTTTTEPAERISEAQLMEIAKEVGLSPASVNQALAEERTHLDLDIPPETGWLSQITGPTMVSAQRVVAGDTQRVMSILDQWMQDGECLQVQRQFPNRMVWEPRNDWAGIMKRAWKTGGRAYHLSEACGVAATVVPVDAEQVVVRLDADVKPARTRRVGLGAGLTAFGVLAGATLGTLGALFNVADLGILAVGATPVIATGAGSYAILRSHRSIVARVKLGLEQAIDKVDYGVPRKPGLIETLVGRPLLR